MRDLNELNHWRNSEFEKSVYGQGGDARHGMFSIPSVVDRMALNVIASSGAGWDHVSVSRGDRTPTWREMESVKRHFFLKDECVMQLHPPLDDYIDGAWPGGKSRFCLHLWRPTDVEIPRPPIWLVGARSREEADQFNKTADAYFAEHPEET